MTPSTPTASDKSDKSDGPYYAWNTFKVDFDEHGVPTETIKPGDPVTQSDLGVSDEEWEELIETGAVSDKEYPDVPDQVSPAEYEADQDVHVVMEDVTLAHQEEMDEKYETEETAEPKQQPSPGTQTKPAGSSSTSKS